MANRRLFRRWRFISPRLGGFPILQGDERIIDSSGERRCLIGARQVDLLSYFARLWRSLFSIGPSRRHFHNRRCPACKYSARRVATMFVGDDAADRMAPSIILKEAASVPAGGGRHERAIIGMKATRYSASVMPRVGCNDYGPAPMLLTGIRRQR